MNNKTGENQVLFNLLINREREILECFRKCGYCDFKSFIKEIKHIEKRLIALQGEK